MENTEHEAILMTLCFAFKQEQVLLGMKKRGFGVGKWNGFGGKVLQGESLREAAMREFKEESGLTALSLEEVGVLVFSWENGRSHEAHVFVCKEWEGILQETEEMKAQWFSSDKIPYREMWSDDVHWFPLLLAGKKFSGRFSFTNSDELIDYSLNEFSL